MKFWENIIDNATLGTAKTTLKYDDIPKFFTTAIEFRESSNREEDFLQLASIVYQYRKGGAKPLDLNSINQAKAETELLPYTSDHSTQIFRAIISEELYPLLHLWLHQCKASGKLAEPELIPELLNFASKRKDLRKIILMVCGKRGEWLSQFNPEWNFSSTNAEIEEVWQTGKLEERKELLKELRKSSPTKAIDLLKSTWDAESANEKATFLELLKVDISSADLLFLESLNEKGQKVNALVLDLLKLIPDSTVVKDYWNLVKNAVVIKNDKALFGIVSKTFVEINENLEVSEPIFKSGIDKLSSSKLISDTQYILIQLISSVPPLLLNEHFNGNNQTIIELFQKERKSATYIPAIAQAAIKFKDIQWIKDLLDHCDKSLIDSSLVLLIKALPERERSKYLLRFIKEKPQQIISIATEHEEEWSVELAKEILKFTAEEVYSYNRTFYKPIISLIPIKLLDELDSFTPSDEQKKTYWKTQSDELSRQLVIKKQILQSF